MRKEIVLQYSYIDSIVLNNIRIIVSNETISYLLVYRTAVISLSHFKIVSLNYS